MLRLSTPKSLTPISPRPSVTTASGSIPALCHTHHLTLVISIFWSGPRPSQFLRAQAWDQAAPCSSLLLFLNCVLLLVSTLGTAFSFLFCSFLFIAKLNGIIIIINYICKTELFLVMHVTHMIFSLHYNMIVWGYKTTNSLHQEGWPPRLPQ